MITRLTNFTLRGYQSYSIDKSLIKKVFSVRKDKKSDDQKTRMLSLSNLKQSGLDESQNKLKESIQDRVIFSYGYDRNCWQKWIAFFRWFFCECWC